VLVLVELIVTTRIHPIIAMLACARFVIRIACANFLLVPFNAFTILIAWIHVLFVGKEGVKIQDVDCHVIMTLGVKAILMGVLLVFILLVLHLGVEANAHQIPTVLLQLLVPSVSWGFVRSLVVVLVALPTRVLIVPLVVAGKVAV